VFKYAAKRVSKSWKLFSALLIASILGATFFAGVTISADIVSRQAARQSYSSVPIDFYVTTGYGQGTNISSQQLVGLSKDLSQIDGINGTEVISKGTATVGNTSTMVEIEGVQNNSLVTQGMELKAGTEPLGANETYVWIGSSDLGTLDIINSVIPLNFTIFNGTGQRSLVWNLTVKGVVILSDRGLAIIREQFYSYFTTYITTYNLPYSYTYWRENILLVSWDLTSRRLWDVVNNISLSYGSPLRSAIAISIDRDRLVNPYDVSASISTLTTLQARIQNTVSTYGIVTPYGIGIDSPLLNALSMYQMELMFLQLSFFGIAIPIFVLAWYMGGTASEVSYNLRRREIGLLSSRGFTSRSITRLLVTEAMLIGLLSGFIGFVVGLLIVPIILGPAFPAGIQAFGYALSTAGISTFVETIVFSTFLAVLSVYRAARKAAGLKTIDALKEYVHVEEAKKPRISKLTWLAFILGTYKIVAWIIGFVPSTLLLSMTPNIILFLVLWILSILDGILGIIGPILFLYGSIKLVMQGSVKLQKKIGSTGRRLFKDAGSIATMNVQRNRARYAMVAFLIALVAGYGVYVVTGSASDRDYTYRSAYTNVGADVSTSVYPSSNLTYLCTAVSNVSGVSKVTYQRNVEGSSSGGYMLIRAIDPTKWLQVAYYENEWFRGVSAEKAFQSMAKDNNTIILDSSVAQYLALGINDSIAVTFSIPSGTKLSLLRVIGFFGPEQTPTQYGTYIYYTPFWSYVSNGLLTKVGGSSISDQLLVKVNQGANITLLVDEIQKVQNVSSVVAADSVLSSYYSNYLVTGPSDVTNVGIALAVVGASLETAVVVLITLIERRREIALLSVRGMSVRQTSSILLIELLSISSFALALGTLVGLIMTWGSVNSTTSFYVQLVKKRMLFPLDSILIILGILALVTLSVIVPILVAARRARKNITATWG
jgi:ABC-type antimicrobial peptide transport system permease subunit